MRGKILTILFVLALIGIAFGYWYYSRNSYSKETLKLELLGPDKVNLADEVEYVVKYKNNGNVRLESPKLIFEYPTSSLPVEDDIVGADGSDSLRREKVLTDIYPGEEKSFTFKARLLGKENEPVLARAWLNYQPKNLSVRYESATTLTTIIKSVPITFEFDLSSRVNAGEDIIFRINYFSNVSYPLSDLRVQTQYPTDFQFADSTPGGLDDNEWEIPVLNRADGGRIEISGKMAGDVGEEKSFTAKLGIWRDNQFILLKEITKSVVLIEPSLYISQKINGNPEYVASPGDQLHYEISFRNIGDKPLTSLFLISRLTGEMLDFTTFKSDTGKYEQGDNSVVFDWRRVPKLQFLDAKEEGQVEFWVELKDTWDPNNPEAKNPVIREKIILGQAQKEFTTKVSSRLDLSQKGYYQDEVFGNTGPLPPRVGEVTTYTVLWQVRNLYGEVKNVRMKATLPPEARLTGEIFPDDQKSKFAFDPLSREIVWELGDMEAGKGVTGQVPNISFQVAFAPTINQRGQVATLVAEVQVAGEDTWGGQMIKFTAPLIDTTMPDDPSITDKTGKVQ